VGLIAFIVILAVFGLIVGALATARAARA